MGEVRVKVTMRNFVDVALAERGSGTIEDIPTSHLDCLVATGAVMVLLPEDEVGKLGLSRGGRVIVTYANDHREELPVARGLEVSLLGRSMVTDCVIGPPLCEPLIGRLVLEELVTFGENTNPINWGNNE